MASATKSEILERFSELSVPIEGIGSWLTEGTDDDIFARLGRIDEEPLTAVQLNQLLVLGHEAPVSDGYFRYYWLSARDSHPYDVRAAGLFDEKWLSSDAITSLEHLKWGLTRLYFDALLFYGSIRTAFRKLRDLPYEELDQLLAARRFDTDAIKRRGPPLPLKPIAKDNRYLISEMACKSYGEMPSSESDLRKVMVGAFRAHAEAGNPRPTIRQLLEGDLPEPSRARQQEFIFSAEEVLDEVVESQADIDAKFERVAAKFSDARQKALDNTRYYLSMVNDLDVYVATSMRDRSDFRMMADICETIFGEGRLKALNLRYFDPTLSAAGGHECEPSDTPGPFGELL